MPVTTVFGGLLGRVGQRFYHRIAREGTLTRALIARLGLVERIALTPAGIPAERACRAVDIAIDLGLPVLHFSFHPPSLHPGKTHLVRSAAVPYQLSTRCAVLHDPLPRRGVEPTDAARLAARDGV